MQDMDAHAQLAFLSTHITAVDGLEGEIAEWGSLILENEKMTGCQRIRCFPPGIFNIRRRSAGPDDSETGDLGGGGQGACANGFHGKNVHDCVFAIPGPDSDVSYAEFDFKDHRSKKSILYGRVYCIFTIAVKFKRKRRRNDPVGSEVDFIVKEDCILLKEFVKCQPNFIQGNIIAGNARSAASASAQALSNAGCVKLREAPHSNSIWRVLPVRHILGQVPLAPLTYQKSKKPFWRHKDDVTEERMWWTIAWTMNWGRDKSYKICREVQEQLDSERRRRSKSNEGARRGPGRPMSRSTLALRARQVQK